ncbi:NAD(P)/FAD-dependent oxidoreductase [Crenobacter sp. SG2303]|uniref:NAD(P)/FAD-dependent oxidoreductase n=1 Tax=Crenobacter oryzisoli TaxID=3056844 RepID=A0ABT7XU17_9NEIS|nr:NAD(P)/FAD-dependent oxidoreductase [Crenobacter sp. SG2303]MDN0077228.1 NAD(P)/FAD-dependent oxidoreductase [Crenobacter sp. SG2303]
MSRYFDVIIIGAGAAGLMAAASAGQRGRRVLLIDHAVKLAEKIRISGGGRCNFTNLNVRPECYLSANPHYVRSALAQYSQHDFIALVERYGIAYHEKTLGQLFCDESSQQIIDMLDAECRTGNVERVMGVIVDEVGRSDRFILKTSLGELASESLVVATGGLSIPQIGATPFGYRLAEQFGQTVTELAPALVPLTFHVEDAERFAPLAGIALDVEARAGKAKFRENALFTHKGVSGPAILQVSSYWQAGEALTLDLLPGVNLDAELAEREGSEQKLANTMAELGWPKRFAEVWLAGQGLDIRVRELSAKRSRQLVEAVARWSLLPNGTQGYKKAEVTRGGIDTKQLDSKTMMSKSVPGLFFVGEVVDVTGWLGGYNFQWAWSSGYVAGQHC